MRCRHVLGPTPRRVDAAAVLCGATDAQRLARALRQAAGTALRVELNAALPGVAPSKAPPALTSSALASAAAALLSALAAVTSASAVRGAACAGGAAGAAANLAAAVSADAARVAAMLASAPAAAQAVPALAATLALAGAMERACDVLNAEVAAAAAAVAALEAAKGGAGAQAAPAPTPADPAAAAAAEKAAAAKEKKGRGGGAPTLGRGSALVRAYAAAGGAVALDSEPLAALLDAVRTLVEANAARRKPKIAKGTRDFLPEQMAIRERAFAAIVSVFKRHGAVALDTPVFELRETLMGKYGEDSKLIYDLADQGGELLALRYDLTVPFARYLAMHAVGNIKRYHIARVYRRDNPAMNRGRFREFYQCDFDIAGAYPAMMADAEVLKVMSEILGSLDIGAFAIKVNHRGLLDAALEVSGVPAAKFRTICSAVDKLDKEPWAEVRREMVEEKGLSPDVADRVGTFVVGLTAPAGQPRELLDKLRAPDSPFGAHAGAAAALADLALLFDYLEAMGALSHFVLDMSLARGLDYYTGVIYEAVLTGGGSASAVGSIGGGGRYDNLVGMFSGKAIPAVGLSVGIERIFNIMEERERAKNPVIRATQTEVLVASIGPNLSKQRMAVAAQLWAAGLKAEYLFAAAPNMQKQLTHALETGIPLMVIFGEDELSAGVLKLKRLADHVEVSVPRDELVARVRELLHAGGAPAAAAPVVVS
jgi:histidyl-tRNA synthetase